MASLGVWTQSCMDFPVYEPINCPLYLHQFDFLLLGTEGPLVNNQSHVQYLFEN